MPQIIAFLFLSVIPLLPALIMSVVSRAAIALGFGTAAYGGFNLIFDNILQRLASTSSGLPSEIINMIGLVGIPEAFNIVLSAGFALLVFKGMSRSGNVRNMVWRKPGDKSPMDWGA